MRFPNFRHQGGGGRRQDAARVGLNLERKMLGIKNILHAYGRRDLTTIGKVTVVKTLIIPQLGHILTIFPSPDSNFITAFNEMNSLFIWNNKKGKINRRLLAQDYEDGGLKLTDFKTQIDALRARWIRYLMLDNEDWTSIFESVTGIEEWEKVQNLDPRSIIEKN